MDLTYDEIVERNNWLEDMGKYSRYAVDSEDSVWVCHECESTDCWPEENECGCEDEYED